MTRSSVDHPYAAVRRELTLGVSYERFTRALESLLGTMRGELLTEIATASPAFARERLASVVGPSEFALFQKIDHGGLLTALAGQTTNAATYVFGNALIAVEMTKHMPIVGLYVPLRLYVRETKPERVLVTYDVPSATLAQFRSPPVNAVAGSLDVKVEKLLADAADLAERGVDAY